MSQADLQAIIDEGIVWLEGKVSNRLEKFALEMLRKALPELLPLVFQFLGSKGLAKP